MYFPIGWPKVLRVPQLGLSSIRQVVCNRDKILLAILTDDSLSIWYCKPCVPIVSYRRSQESVDDVGMNELVEWRPDSSMLVVATSVGHLLFYHLSRDKGLGKKNGLYEQRDSPRQILKRDSAELFIQETIPALSLTSGKVSVGVGGGGVTSLVCIRDELMVATTRGTVLRYGWDGHLHRDHCLDLRRIPFCNDQQVSKAVPILEPNTYVVDIEYSPLVGGFAVVLSDGRAAFLTASSLKFDPNQVQGIWAQNIDDATCAAVNHKYRLIAFGRKNSQGVVFGVDERTGGLEETHRLVLSGRDSPGQEVGPVRCMRWTPDGRALAVAWGHVPRDSPLISPGLKCEDIRAPTGAGLSVWSTFGALLMCTLGWNNQTTRLNKFSDGPFTDRGCSGKKIDEYSLNIHSLEWSAEGYQLWMVQHPSIPMEPDMNVRGGIPAKFNEDTVIVLDFVKSALTVNPTMSNQGHICLQGDDRLYINLGGRVGASRGKRKRAGPSSPHHSSSSRSSSTTSSSFSSPLPLLPNHFSSRVVGRSNDRTEEDDADMDEEDEEGGFGGVRDRGKMEGATEAFMGSKQWIVVPIPSSYLGTNWPIRYAAVVGDGQGVAVAGRTGLAHVTLPTCRWRLFGNETQERDFAVTGGLLWWKPYSQGKAAVLTPNEINENGSAYCENNPVKDSGPVVIVAGVYNVARDRDEIRVYPREGRLEDSTAGVARVGAQVLLMDALGPILLAFTADARLCLIRAAPPSNLPTNGLLTSASSAASPSSSSGKPVSSTASAFQGACLELVRLQEIDISALCVHAACVVSASLTSLRAETNRPPPSSARLTCWKRHRKKSRVEEEEEEMLGEEEENECEEDGDEEGVDGDLESIVLNVSGRLMMVQRDRVDEEGEEFPDVPSYMPPFRWVGAQQGAGSSSIDGELVGATVLASGVEGVWAPRGCGRRKPQLRQALWLYCGAAGARVWLPLLPRPGRRSGHEGAHSFMAKRIMLPFQLRIYPLAILFEDAILLGAESDTTIYSADPSLPFSLPFCVVERTSQVYLHQILRQLLRRNLGFHAWEIARLCTSLPYFPHSLELLLHEVLEEEATSKDPLPDALLPGVVEFIGEFPRERPRCIVQCARKTEVALWPCLFAAVGRPRILFERCLAAGQLRTAASYLIILQAETSTTVNKQIATNRYAFQYSSYHHQVGGDLFSDVRGGILLLNVKVTISGLSSPNLECSSVSRQHATQLLDAALEQGRWELSRDLVRFLRAIDPNDVESPRASFSMLPSKFTVGSPHPQTPAVCPNEEDLSLLLGTMQVSRGRSFSTTSATKVPGWGAGSGESKASGGPEPSPQIPIPQVASSGSKSAHKEIIRSNSESRSVGGSSGSGLTERIRKKSEPGGACIERADEEPYLDLVLQRHACKLLKAGRLGDLGRLSAWHAPYFGLVSWLRTEKEGGTRLPLPPEVALRSLHANLRWPFPLPARSPSELSHQSLPTAASKLTGDSRSSSSGIHSLPTPTDEAVGSAFDSKRDATSGGKHSQVAQPVSTEIFPSKQGQILEAQLMPHVISSQGEDRSYRSEESSWWDDEAGEEAGWSNGRDVVGMIDDSGNRMEDEDQEILEEMEGEDERVAVGEKVCRNEPTKDSLCSVDAKSILENGENHTASRAEVQLRYLHQIFVEAHCLEWALIVAVALRDLGALAHTVRAALRPQSTSCPSPVIEANRLKEILMSLYEWSSSQCLVYKPFLSLACGHVQALSKYASGMSSVPLVEEAKGNHPMTPATINIPSRQGFSNSSLHLAPSCGSLDAVGDRMDNEVGEDVMCGSKKEELVHHNSAPREEGEQCDDEDDESFSDDDDADFTEEENGSQGMVCVLS